MINLRDYQRDLIRNIHQAFTGGYHAVLGQAPTGAGKTVIFSYITDGAIKQSNKTVILVHRQELILQTALALGKFQIPHKIIAPQSVIKTAAQIQYKEFGRNYIDFNSPCVVASVQTLGRKLDEYKNYFNFIITDECHHAVAGQWRNITDANPHAYLLGLSATPERLDGKGLGVECGGVYETLVLGPSVRSLIEQGYLSQPRVFAPPIDFNSDSLKTIAGDYDVKQMAEMLDRPQIIGDAVKHYAKICPNMPAIAFCATIEHAQHTAEQFCQAGFKFKSIDGTMSDYERRDAIEGLGSGRYDGLTSCNIISEGTDIPVVGCAIFLRKTKSLGLYLQQAGRVLRPYSGKKYSIILDHVRNVEMHGFPDDDREWSLEGRKKRNRQDGEQLFVRTCLNCYACYPSKLKACPVCGCENATKTRQEIEYIDAELLEMKRQERIDERKHAFAFSQLLEIGKRRGYKNPYAWAKIVLNSRRKGKK